MYLERAVSGVYIDGKLPEKAGLYHITAVQIIACFQMRILRSIKIVFLNVIIISTIVVKRENNYFNLPLAFQEDKIGFVAMVQRIYPALSNQPISLDHPSLD